MHNAVRAALILLLFWPLLAASQESGRVFLLDIDGVIGPATQDYVKRSLDKATDQGADLVVLRIDTPGGLDNSMRGIIRDIIASPVPVVSYVAPGGSRAASAGTYILYASHIAAMAPATNLGAATPVQLGGTAPGAERKPSGADENKSGEGDAMSRKMINDATAYIRGLAQLRGRNAEWAEQAVRGAASLSAEAALRENVIDLVATDVPDLLKQLDGRSVTVLGQERVLDTQGLTVQTLAPDWRTRLLAIITDPNIASILMMLGILGLIYEFLNPGLILPGVAGAIALLLALFAFQTLPIDYAGLALMLLGIAFIVGELAVPSGILGIGGLIAFVIGSIMLMDTDMPGYGISLPLIGGVALLCAGLMLLIVHLALKSRQRPVVTGREEMIGSIGEVIEDFDGAGRIRVHGEIWQATSTAPLARGQKVQVTQLEGLVLTVKPREPLITSGTS